jgi:hypothetical protein
VLADAGAQRAAGLGGRIRSVSSPSLISISAMPDSSSSSIIFLIFRMSIDLLREAPSGARIYLISGNLPNLWQN